MWWFSNYAKRGLRNFPIRREAYAHPAAPETRDRGDPTAVLHERTARNANVPADTCIIPPMMRRRRLVHDARRKRFRPG